MKINYQLTALLIVVILFSCKESATDTVEEKTLTDAEWVDALPDPWTLTQDQMDVILPQFQTRFPYFQARLKNFALWRVGTPYEIFKLGEEVEPDPDPIIRYDVSDCTGHNLTSLAAAKSSSWSQTKSNMIDIHYKADAQGVKTPTYISRWHYTLDRITANPYTVDITQDLLPRSSLDSVSITLNKKDDGSEFLELDWGRSMTAYFIPNDQITAELLAKLPQIVGVAFVKPNYYKMGIVMGHEGMIIDGKYLVHASQSAGETVKLDFLEYYFPEDGAFFGGIMIYEFRENV